MSFLACIAACLDGRVLPLGLGLSWSSLDSSVSVNSLEFPHSKGYSRLRGRINSFLVANRTLADLMFPSELVLSSTIFAIFQEPLPKFSFSITISFIFGCLCDCTRGLLMVVCVLSASGWSGWSEEESSEERSPSSVDLSEIFALIMKQDESSEEGWSYVSPGWGFVARLLRLI